MKANNSSSAGNPKVIKKAKDTAELKRIIDPKRGLNQAHNIASSLVLLGAAGRASGVATRAAANRAGASASERAIANSVAKTSRTLNVPKGTNVITSGKTGIAKVATNVSKVVVQKNPARVAAGIKTNAARVGQVASKAELARLRSTQAVAGVTVATKAVISAADKKKKK